MATLERPALGYFRVEKNVQGIWGLILSANEGGAPAWVYRLNPMDQDGPRLSTSLLTFLNEKMIRNIEPIYDATVLQASDALELGYSVQEMILAAISKAIAPEVTWQDVVDRIDRMQAQLDYLRHIAAHGLLQWPDRDFQVPS